MAKRRGAPSADGRSVDPLWGFGAGAQTAAPTPAALAAAQAAVGDVEAVVWVLMCSSRRPPSTSIWAVAKGYAVDPGGVFGGARGAAHGLVEIGGEVVAGLKAARWCVETRGGCGVDNTQRQVSAAIIKLYNKAMATSGDYRQFRMENGRLTFSIWSTRTAEPVDHGLANVTVVAPDCASADTYATAPDGARCQRGRRLGRFVASVDALFLERQARVAAGSRAICTST